MSVAAGSQAEEYVARWLEETKDWVLIEKNWKRPRCEVDLIMRDTTNTIRFIEVKYRTTNRAGSGLEYVTAAKQKKLKIAVLSWFKENEERAVSIDVVAMDGNGVCTLIENAIQEG